MVLFFLSPIYSQYKIDFSYKQSFYLNTNLPNLENHNGQYFPKGYGSFSSILIKFNLKNITLSIEPVIINQNEYEVGLPNKDKIFSVLNDVPQNNNYKPPHFRNTGIKIHYQGIVIGLGNWDQWWGPGIHNSLVLSNNAEGFYNYFLGTNSYQPIVKDLSYKIKYMVSDAKQNQEGDNYFLSAWFLNLKYKVFEFG